MQQRHRKGPRLPGPPPGAWRSVSPWPFSISPSCTFRRRTLSKRRRCRPPATYLNLAGTQVASVLLGFPPLDRDTATLAEFSTLMLRSAALCEGLLELADDLDRQ